MVRSQTTCSIESWEPKTGILSEYSKYAFRRSPGGTDRLQRFGWVGEGSSRSRPILTVPTFRLSVERYKENDGPLSAIDGASQIAEWTSGGVLDAVGCVDRPRSSR